MHSTLQLSETLRGFPYQMWAQGGFPEVEPRAATLYSPVLPGSVATASVRAVLAFDKVTSSVALQRIPCCSLFSPESTSILGRRVILYTVYFCRL